MNRLPATLALLVCAGALAQGPAPEEIMRQNDLNEDGVITRQEAEEAGTPLAMFFDELDSDMDGRLTMEELRNAEPPG